MDAVFASLVAVAGTLLGVVVSYLLQRHHTRETARFAREDRRRAEQVEAFSAFAETVLQFRRAQHDRWWRQQEAPDKRVPASVRDESYRLRAASWHALFRMRLLSDDPVLIGLAHAAVEAAVAIPRATSEDDEAAQGDVARDALDNFIVAAASALRGASSQAAVVAGAQD